ncbi:MAG: hypothetical protein A4E53_01696 [Pelotomaculum sp. PtaB.Bin104]|nr:MAG: hypothetical protein A4E53_01696 [Pelotomaculum sp. PtaB.Bin104]
MKNLILTMLIIAAMCLMVMPAYADITTIKDNPVTINNNVTNVAHISNTELARWNLNAGTKLTLIRFTEGVDLNVGLYKECLNTNREEGFLGVVEVAITKPLIDFSKK